jgi:hypothetical protein
MAGRRSNADINAAITVPRERRLATGTARDQLYELVKERAGIEKGVPSLTKRAVEIGPRGRGGALLLPLADAEAMAKHVAELEDHIEQLTDEIEEMNLAALIAPRLETPEEDLLTVEQFAEGLGLGHLATGEA